MTEPVAWRLVCGTDVFLAAEFTPDAEHRDEWEPLYTHPAPAPASQEAEPVAWELVSASGVRVPWADLLRMAPTGNERALVAADLTHEYGKPHRWEPLYKRPAPAPASLRDMTEADFDKAHGITPASVPDVAGLTHKLLYWARSSAENRPQAADAMREAAAALAALQSQVDNFHMEYRMKCDVETKQQAERITELTAKLAEAVGLLDKAAKSTSPFLQQRIFNFLTKAREAMG